MSVFIHRYRPCKTYAAGITYAAFFLVFWGFFLELLLLFTLFLRLELWLPVGMDQTLVLYISEEMSLSSRYERERERERLTTSYIPPTVQGLNTKYIQNFQFRLDEKGDFQTSASPSTMHVWRKWRSAVA